MRVAGLGHHQRTASGSVRDAGGLKHEANDALGKRREWGRQVSASIKLAVLRLISRCGYTVLKNYEYQRLQQLEAKLVRTASAFADSRKGHEYALRELEQSRAEVFELLDENRRLNTRVAEVANSMKS